MIKRIRTSCIAIAVLMVGIVGRALAQKPAVAKYHTYWLPDQATQIAADVDSMFYIILWLTSVVFVLVAAVLIYFLIRYRARPGGKAIYNHGNTRLEIVWTVIPALIVILLGIYSKDLWSQIKQRFPDEKSSVVIDVRPRQFQWDYSYAGADGKFGTPDDISFKSREPIHVPAGRNVLIRLNAQDVIHSFFIPELRIKQDAVPGMVTKTWFNIPKPGEYVIACAELCGIGHGSMSGQVIVEDGAAFDKWYAERIAETAKRLTPPPAAAAAPAAPVDTMAVTSVRDSSASPNVPHSNAAADSAAPSTTDTSKKK